MLTTSLVMLVCPEIAVMVGALLKALTFQVKTLKLKSLKQLNTLQIIDSIVGFLLCKKQKTDFQRQGCFQHHFVIK